MNKNTKFNIKVGVYGLILIFFVACISLPSYSGKAKNDEVYFGYGNVVNLNGFTNSDSKNLAQISEELKRLNRNIEKFYLRNK